MFDEASKNVTLPEEKLLWKQEFENASVKLKTKEAKLKDFCDKTGLRRDRYREQVFAAQTENGIKNFGKSVSQKAVQASQKHYDIWRKSIGADDTPKTLAKYYDMKYNNKKEYELLNRYVKSVESGAMSPLINYSGFKSLINEIDNQIIGISTSAGLVIRSQSNHFVERVVGTMKDPKNGKIRNGVSISDIKATLQKPKRIDEVKYDSDGKPSIKYHGEICQVTVNPLDSNLIQVNPKRKGHKNET